MAGRLCSDSPDLPKTTLRSSPSRRSTQVLVVFDLFSMYFLRLFPSISSVYSYAKPLMASILMVALVFAAPTKNVSLSSYLFLHDNIYSCNKHREKLVFDFKNNIKKFRVF